MIDNSKILELPITETQFLPAFLIRKYQEDDATEEHIIAYAQCKIIDYSNYKIYDEWLEEGETPEVLMTDPKDTLYLRDKKNGVSYYAHIEVLSTIDDFIEFEKFIK